jgi:hypothetical protein
MCASADITASGNDAPGTLCDAISIGIAFETTPVRTPFSTVQAAIPTNPCDAGFDPADDSCMQ